MLVNSNGMHIQQYNIIGRKSVPTWKEADTKLTSKSKNTRNRYKDHTSLILHRLMSNNLMIGSVLTPTFPHVVDIKIPKV